MKSFLKFCTAGFIGAFLGIVGPALADQVISDNLTLKGYLSATNYGLFGSGVAPVAGGSTRNSVCMSSTAGLCVYVGSGAPTISAAQGSIYLRTDGSSTSTRIYVNSTGSTTWVAVTTAS